MTFYRMSLDKNEIQKILSRECNLIIRDLNKYQEAIRVSDTIIGLENFGFLENKTLVHQVGASEVQAVEIRHNGRWRSPFSLPSEHSRLRLEVRNLSRKLLKEISDEEVSEAGYKYKSDLMKSYNKRFDEHRWRLNEQPVTLIWFQWRKKNGS